LPAAQYYVAIVVSRRDLAGRLLPRGSACAHAPPIHLILTAYFI